MIDATITSTVGPYGALDGAGPAAALVAQLVYLLALLAIAITTLHRWNVDDIDVG